ncbi:Npun_F0494 family protein [Gloeocapsa sp. PCC 73106]|uniref:Npun_F0494 family protein n=1 Tax=Gloeocapsa sp. PCC 73106 TaxID=102232 RepID=UPI000552E92E|nr:Npun_F0494 family protein [Gloeocapsa sp. PCC 73106]
MPHQSREKEQTISSYSIKTRKRATLAVICSPFKLNLFVTMAKISLPLPQIAGSQSVEKGYTYKPNPEPKVEQELMWLIKVGILRREVDGQGITDSFRLTPLGRQVIAQWGVNSELPRATWKDHLVNLYSRLLNFSLY